jgi:hypothetical protein
MKAEEIADLLPFLTPEERAEVDKLLAADTAIWRPLPGPQSTAYRSTADIIGYGGAAGGGKTDLACGLALTKHRTTAIFRRESTQLTGVIDRLEALVGNKDGFNGQKNIWRLPGRQVEFGSTPHLGDETKYQGRPKDLLVIDEAANFLEQQVRFLMGWVRTTVPGQKCTVLLTFNPPTTPEGRWLISFFAPWLDDKHPNPAKPGEVRWFATIDGKDVEVPTGDVFMHDGEHIKPLSRTFVSSRVSDNPYLMGTGYMATLQSLPEPLRSQMLKGDFLAGNDDDPWQVIPTAWVDAAQARWTDRPRKGVMDSMGVDVARGGADQTVIARRHGGWFDKLLTYPGTATPNGDAVFAYVMAARRDLAPVHIDVIGWGASAYDCLARERVQALPMNGAGKAVGRTKDARLGLVNRRAEMWWRMREALDPANEDEIALPPDNELRADLVTPRWELRTGGIIVEAKEDIKARIGRSPDKGDAVCMALIATRKMQEIFDEEDDRPRGRSASTGY